MEKTSKKNSDFYDAWIESQKNFLKSWTDTTKNFQKMFADMSWTNKEIEQDTQTAFGNYKLWVDTFGKYFDTMIKNYPINPSTDTVARLFKGADTYMKLYEFWKPIINALQEKAIDPDSYKDIMDPSKYKEMMDKVFGFNSPETMTEFYGQASHLMETWGSKAELLVKPWVDLIQKNINVSLNLAAGDPDASMDIFHNIYSAFESTFGKAFKMPTVGKDREQTELLLKTLDKYSIFLAKNVEFQHVMYRTGQEAMDEVVKAVAKKIRDDEDISSFEEFFKLWTSINERAFLNLFKTEEFSSLQGVILDVALDARVHSQQLIELYLKDFPVALRSEMDDVYQTIYNLKRNVRSLMKKSPIIDVLQQETIALKEKVNMLEKNSPPCSVQKELNEDHLHGHSAKTPRKKTDGKEVKK